MSTIGGSRNTKYLAGSGYNINGANIIVPSGLFDGKLHVPDGTDEFFTRVSQLAVINTPVTLAAVVTGKIPVLMGFSMYTLSTDASISIRRTDNTKIFDSNFNTPFPATINFAPYGIITSLTEHGLQVIQTSGTAAFMYCVAWGFYADIP